MKYLIVTVLVAAVCFASDPDAGPQTGELQHSQAGSDDYTITLTTENVFTLNFGSYLRGCDYVDGYGELLISDYDTDSVYSVDPTTGTMDYGIACPPEIPDVLGICAYITTDNYILINDWKDILNIWRFGTTTGWEFAYANPSPEPRGMDVDDAMTVWEIDAASRVLYHFDLNGSLIETFSLTELPATYACGLSVFPFEGDLGIVVGGYAYADFYFYRYDGSTMEFINSAPVPQAMNQSYGISYSCDTSSYFWVYRDASSNYYLCEFTAEIEQVSLEQSTWGSIKSIF